MEFISPEGLRLDGRRPQELRRLKGELGVLVCTCPVPWKDALWAQNHVENVTIFARLLNSHANDASALFSWQEGADGSAAFEMGNTRVIAAVYGPRPPERRGDEVQEKASVRCEYLQVRGRDKDAHSLVSPRNEMIATLSAAP